MNSSDSFLFTSNLNPIPSSSHLLAFSVVFLILQLSQVYPSTQSHPVKMSFDPNNATTATMRALQEAISLAEAHSNPELTPAHIAYVLFRTDGGLATRIANKLNVVVRQLVQSLQDLVNKLPKQTPAPSNVHWNHSCRNVLNTAEKLRVANKDGHVSIDHLLIALYEDDPVSRVLQQHGLPKKKVEETVKQVRGGASVDSKQAEDNYEALEKYGHNLVVDAENGKLDPVIGRDTEIRRVIQILSRRTKNNPILIGEPGVGKVRDISYTTCSYSTNIRNYTIVLVVGDG